MEDVLTIVASTVLVFTVQQLCLQVKNKLFNRRRYDNKKHKNNEERRKK